jgi:uncharacterized protein (DUF488 family)
MQVYTIGHSNLTIESFIELLKKNNIQVLVDVRSHPYSKYVSQFNKETFQRSIENNEIEYIYLGNQLGGKPHDATLHNKLNIVDYGKLEKSQQYIEGIKKLEELASNKIIAIMCSEGSYKECHRYKLITKTLEKNNIEVLHILPNGKVEQAAQKVFF